MKCKTCGNLIETGGGKFCPSCGADLEEGQDVPTSAPPAGVPCPKCGFVNVSPSSRFCTQCGGSLVKGEAVVMDPVPGQVVASTPYVPPSSPSPQTKTIMGRTLKHIPFSKMITSLQDIGGSITLHQDGVVFSGKGNNTVQCHIQDIAKVVEGKKSDILGIKMKSGEEYVFKLMGAKKWVKMLNEML